MPVLRRGGDLSNHGALYVPAPGGGAYTGPGDLGISGAMHWWGLRAYNAAKIGTNAVQLKRSSDNTFLDVTTGADGNLDLTTAGYTAWAGADTISIRTFYDQVGSNNLVNASAAQQPLFVLNGIGSLACARIDDSFRYIPSASVLSATAQPVTASLVGKRTGRFTTSQAILGDNNTTISAFYSNAANAMKLYAGSNGAAVTVSDSAWHALQFVWNGASSDINVDGSVNTVNPGTNGLSASLWLIGAWNGEVCDVDFAETGIWGAAFSGANSSAVATNQSTHWGY